MRTAGLTLLLLTTLCTLSSFLPAWEQPVSMPPFPEGRLHPLPYTLPLEYVAMVIYASDTTGVPVWMLSRLFAWESGWNADYRGRMNSNGTYDYGLAALNSGCLDDFRKYNDMAPVNPFDPATAVRVGANYVAALRAETGSWREAIRRYAGNRSESHTRAILGEAK